MNILRLLSAAMVAVTLASCSELEHPVSPKTHSIPDSGVADTIALPGMGKPAANPNRLAGDPRRAIQLECFYALNTGYYGGSTRTLNGNYVSDWAYLRSDLNAYTVMKNFFGGNASVWKGWPSFYSNMDVYSFMSKKWGGGDWSAAYGRGGQCRMFANLILFRSETYWDNSRYLRSYGTYIDDYNSGRRQWTKPITTTAVGDVIQTKWINGHTAIVVHIVTYDASGRVVALEVVDSNFIGGDGNEIIGRHILRSIPSGQPGDGGTSDLDSYIALNLPLR